MAKKPTLTIASSNEPYKFTNQPVTDIKMVLNRCYKFRRNVITRNIEVGGIPIDDKMLNSIFINVKTNLKKATKELVSSIIFSDFVNDYNPFSEILNHYIENPPARATGHIDALIATINTDTPNAPLFIKKWLISLIGSINYIHSPLMLVLCGPQNTGKTEWFRRLLPESLRKYYAESKLDLGKDDEILMTKKLIIMDDEMSGKSKTEEKKLKEMTSKQIFSVREPYGRVSEDLQRLAVLCGTANDEELLSDPTGNRRILPVRVLSIDHKAYNSINKDLVFFECWLEYENGFNYRLNKDEIELLKESSKDFERSIPEEELIKKYFDLPEAHPQTPIQELTSTEILSIIQNRSNIKISQTRLGLTLKKLGFIQKHSKWNGTTKRVYPMITL